METDQVEIIFGATSNMSVSNNGYESMELSKKR